MRPLLPALTLLGLAASPARADLQQAGVILDRYAAVGKEMTEILKGVKDKATATAAREKVAKLHGAMADCAAELAKLPKPTEAEIKELEDRIRKTLAPFDAEFVRLSLIPEAFAVFADFEMFKDIAESYELEAQLRALKNDVALTAYWIKHQKYPATLEEGFKLTKWEVLKDPWGRDYFYDPAGPRNKAVNAKSTRPDIWVVSPYGDGKKLLGNWEEKK